MAKALHRAVWEMRERMKQRVNIAMRAIQEHRSSEIHYTMRARCAETGMDYNGVRRVLYSRNPTLERLVILSEVIGVRLEWLLFGDMDFDSIEWLDGGVPEEPEGGRMILISEEELKQRSA